MKKITFIIFDVFEIFLKIILWKKSFLASKWKAIPSSFSKTYFFSSKYKELKCKSFKS